MEPLKSTIGAMLASAPRLATWVSISQILLGAYLCQGQNTDSRTCSPSGLETFIIPPFQAVPSTGLMKLVLLVRNCSGHQLSLQGVPDVHFFLSAAAAGNLDGSGPAPIGISFDYFTPGNPEDDRRAAPVALQADQSAHILLAYFSKGVHIGGSVLPETRRKIPPSSCQDVDVLTLNVLSLVGAFRGQMHICGGVYVSEYRHGPFVSRERISPDFLNGSELGTEGTAVVGPPVALVALERSTDIGLRECESEDLDVKFEASGRSVDPATTVFRLQNISEDTCVIWRESSVTLGSQNLAVPGEMILPPQTRAHVNVTYRTGPNGPSPCKALSEIRFSAFPVVRSGTSNQIFVYLGQHPLSICSPAEVTPILPDPVRNPLEPGPPRSVLLKLTSEKTTYYDREYISFHLTAEGPSNLLDVDEHLCLPLFQRSRSPNGLTRVDQIAPRRCTATTSSFSSSNRLIEMEIDAGNRSSWDGRGEHMFDLVYVPPQGKPNETSSTTSNTLLLNIADAGAIPRDWGPRTKGVAVDVTLDRDIYALGQDIPLHLAIENFAAGVPIFGQSDDGCFSNLSIEVRDAADGLLVARNQFSPEFICLSGGPITIGLKQYPVGRVFPQERTLLAVSQLPDYSGSFTVAATWTVYDCQLCNPNETKPYAVVRSTPRAFRIIDGLHPQLAPELPKGILSADLAQRFEQVDTALGEKSALKDKASGLKWLHLNITAGVPYNQVISEMSPGKRFEGWRFASPAELKDFFSHFSGSPDGSTTDANIVSQFLRNLGGPLQNVSDRSTGWHRMSLAGILDVPGEYGHALFGYVADDTLSGPTMSPAFSGSTPGDPTNGSYLVQKD